MILSGIYRIKNIVTGEAYVGRAKNIEKRWKEHQCSLKNNKHCNPILQRVYNKCGADIYKYEILEICPPDLTIEREQERLDSKQYIYNISTSAFVPCNIGRRHTDDAKANMSSGKSGDKHHMFGKTLSPEHKAKIGAAHKGIPKSAAAIAKRTASRRVSK